MSISRISPHDGVYLQMEIKVPDTFKTMLNKLKDPKAPEAEKTEILNIIVTEPIDTKIDPAILKTAEEQEVANSVAQSSVRELEDMTRRSITPKALILIVMGTGLTMGIMMGAIFLAYGQASQPLADRAAEIAKYNVEATENLQIFAEVFGESGLTDLIKQYMQAKVNALNTTAPVG